MTRLLLLALLLANALMLAANLGLLAPLRPTLPGLAGQPTGQREPERLSRQFHPELLRVLPADGAGESAVAAAVAAADPEAASAAGAGAARGACLQAGPFNADELAVAQRSLGDAGVPASAWQTLALPARAAAPAAWLIVMGRYADRDTLLRKQDELRRLRVDASELRESAQLPAGLAPGLLLGRYSDKPGADAALARLGPRGVHTARVVAQPAVAASAASAAVMLRLPGADAALQARVAGLQMPRGSLLPCPPEATAGGSPAGKAVGTRQPASAPA